MTTSSLKVTKSKSKIDKEHKGSITDSKTQRNPYAKAGFLSLLTFSFSNQIINRIFKRGTGKTSDIYGTTDDLDTLRVAERIEANWNKYLLEGKDPDLFDIIAVLSFWDSFFRIAKSCCIYKLLGALAAKNLIESTKYALFLIGSLIMTVLIYNYAAYRGYRKGAVLRTALSTLIYKSMLKLRLSSNVSTGEIISLLTNDLQKFDDIVFLRVMIFMPIVELAMIIACYFKSGSFDKPSLTFLIIVAFILIPITIQSLLSIKIGRMKKRSIPIKDEKTKCIADVLSGIQVLKYFHWENPFYERVLAIRKRIIDWLSTCYFLKGTVMGFYFSTSLLCTSLFKFISGKLRAEDSAEIYAINSLMHLIGHSLCYNFPKAVEAYIEVMTASARVSKFLLKSRDCASSLSIVPEMPNDLALKITNATLSWPESSGTSTYSIENDGTTMRIPVKSSTFEIKRGDFCMIMGPVGSGKSALLYSILGELHLIGGEIIHSGKIAFVPQSPWIIAGTIRENILFGREFDQSFYSKVIKTACLELDMKNFENGDLTVVSDNGTTLSGGQRSRISLARALYSKEAELFLLDDVLSAVDNKVGKAIFKGLVNFFEGKKTCLFISHQLQFAKYCSKIMLLKKGSIKYFGTYENLIQNKGIEFVNELITCHSEKKEPEESVSSSETVLLIAPPTSPTEVKEEEYDAYLEENISAYAPPNTFFKFIVRGRSIFIIALIILIFLLTDVLSLLHGILLERQVTGKFIFGFAGLVLATFCMHIGRSILVLDLTLRAAVNLFSDAFYRLLNTNLLYFMEHPQGQILNRLSKDQSMIEENLPAFLLDFCVSALSVLVTIIACLLNQAKCFFALPLIIFPCLFYRRKFIMASTEIKKIESTSRSPCYSMFTSTLPGLSSIRCFGSEKIFLKRYVKYQNFNTSAMHSFIFCSRWFAFRVDFCAVLFLTSFLGLVLFDINDPNSKNKALGLALGKCTALLGLLQWTLRVISEIQTLLTSVDRVEEYTKLPMEELPEVTEKCKKVSDSWPEKGHVSFQNVSLKYPNSTKLVLCGITVELLPSQKIAVVGRTGAGKTSLISAIFRILEPLPADSLKIDNESISAISLGVLRSRIAIIPQEPFLFKGTIRFNLDPFEQFTDEKLWDAIRRAEMQDAVCEMPDQLDSEVQEGGSNFSVGERQLLCLARAILRRPKVIIMDEATANIDILTTEKIIKAMATSFSEATVITIVHRLHTIMEYDRVMVLEKGVIAEFDSPFNLLSDNQSNFSSMVQELGDDAINQMREVARLSDQRKADIKMNYNDIVEISDHSEDSSTNK